MARTPSLPGARPLARARAGLGSGLELILPGRGRDVWANAPVVEPFVCTSPYVLRLRGEQPVVVDERDGAEHPVALAPRPGWHDRRTAGGVPMRSVGVQQGTCLGFYVGPTCGYWPGGLARAPDRRCHFCATGIHRANRRPPRVDDVVEVCRAARDEGTSFFHFNTGFQGHRELDVVEPFVRAVKRRVGGLVGVQALPATDLSAYDRLLELGVDHLSFCFELRDPERFARLCPGKEATLGQGAFYDAIAHTARRLPPGAVSGEIIAGLEPIASTLEAIEHVTAMGAFPTLCVFRPLAGTLLADRVPPPPVEVRAAARLVRSACARRGIPIGLAPGVETSLAIQPSDTFHLRGPSSGERWHRAKMGLARRLLRPRFERLARPLA